MRRRRAPKRGKRASATSSTAGALDVRALQTNPGPGAIHRFTRMQDFITLTKAAGDQGFGITFSLSGVSNYAEFTNLFDKYRITQIEITFLWQRGASDAVQRPILWYYQDWDGSTVPATSSEVMDRGNFHQIMFSEANPTRTVVIKRPAALLATALGAASPARSPWIDCTLPAQVHYGLYGWGAFYNTTTASGTVSYITRYTLEFQASR
jgi:hypothetical protein